MKLRDKLIIALVLTLAVVSSMVAYKPEIIEAQTDYISTWLRNNTTQTTDTKSLRVEFANSVSDFNAKTASSATNTVETGLTTTHETSGSPANGIGVSFDMVQETSAGNNETGARVVALTTDVTAASEDFDLAFYVMDAGATAAEVARFTSDGVFTLEGSATLDNSTSATELNISETTVQLTGAVNMDGGIVTVNQDSGDYDFVVETDNSADALKVDAGTDTVQFGSFISYEIATSSAQSYSISSAGKASVHIQTAGEAATAHLMTDLLTAPGAGGVIILKTGDSNDIVVDTEGAATIEGGATYTIDGTLEATTFINDGTNWHVIGSYLE